MSNLSAFICIVPYEKDINSERVQTSKNKLIARGHSIKEVYVKTETKGYSDPPGIAISYEVEQRKNPLW